jgi:hypothetical protein
MEDRRKNPYNNLKFFQGAVVCFGLTLCLYLAIYLTYNLLTG